MGAEWILVGQLHIPKVPYPSSATHSVSTAGIRHTGERGSQGVLAVEVGEEFHEMHLLYLDGVEVGSKRVKVFPCKSNQ